VTEDLNRLANAFRERGRVQQRTLSVALDSTSGSNAALSAVARRANPSNGRHVAASNGRVAQRLFSRRDSFKERIGLMHLQVCEDLDCITRRFIDLCMQIVHLT
jgi:hypothetical protein